MRAERIAEAHPAHAIIAAKLAHFSLNAIFPDLVCAERWIERVIYLAPTYSLGHRMQARYFISIGERAEGFRSFRESWRFQPRAYDDLLVELRLLAWTADELFASIPRAGPAEDQVKDAYLLSLVRAVKTGRPDWARALLDRVKAETIVEPENFFSWVNLQLQLGEWEEAKAGLSARLRDKPQDEKANLAMLRLLKKHGEKTEVLAFIERALGNGVRNLAPYLSQRFAYALAQDDFVGSRRVIERWAQVKTTRANKVQFALMKARLAEKEGHLRIAMEALAGALRQYPENADLRWSQARLYLKVGQPSRAKRELELLIQMYPDHRPAIRLFQTL